MPDEEKKFEIFLKRSFEELDSQLKIPDIPDAQTIFEANAQKEEKKVYSFRTVRIVAAAAITLVVGLTAFAMGGELGISREKGISQTADIVEPESEPNMAFFGGFWESEEEIPYALESAEGEPTEESSLPEASAEPCDPEINASNGFTDEWKVANGSSLDRSLEDFFALESKAYVTGKSYSSVTDFTDVISNKRSVSVDVNTDSVSVTLYDTSGEEEILSAFWVEGMFLSSKQREKDYLIVIEKKITQEEYESGNYLPLIGDAQKGTEELSENCISVGETVTEGIIQMTISLNVEKGSYIIKAVLK